MSNNFWIVLAIVVVGAGGIVAYRSMGDTPDQATTQPATPTVSYQGEAGKTAMELLKGNATVETTTDPNLGEFVTSVNGVKSGTDGKYWLYYVNGQPATVGAGDYTTADTDTIEWKLE